MGENIVALCDVDGQNLEAAQNKEPEASTFRDYRQLYDKLADSQFDAVVVSTPEHQHAFATMPALKRKKHVYCEKPLTRDVHEATLITKAAIDAGVATQMGTQIHATDNYRRVVELVQSGAIGAVQERTCGWSALGEADGGGCGEVYGHRRTPGSGRLRSIRCRRIWIGICG